MYDAFVTGASGFIGFHLLKYLLKKDKKIVASYNNSNDRLSNFRRIKKVKWDITKKLEIIPSCKVWYHLASLTDINACNNNPKLAYNINTYSIRNVIQHAEKSNCRVFIFVSTLGVYGEPIYFPVDEKHPVKPIEIYSLSKSKAETQLKNMQGSIKKKVIVRLFNTFGPGQNQNMLIPNIINQIHKKTTVQLNNLHQTRDFLYVSDIVNGLFLAAKHGKNNEIYNLGSGFETSIEKLISIIKSVTDNNFKVLCKDDKSQKHKSVSRSQADINKAFKYLTWNPTISLKEGIKLTLKHSKYLED